MISEHMEEAYPRSKTSEQGANDSRHNVLISCCLKQITLDAEGLERDDRSRWVLAWDMFCRAMSST